MNIGLLRQYRRSQFQPGALEQLRVFVKIRRRGDTEGMFQQSMIAAMDALEARKAELSALLAEAPADTRGILPSASQLYAKKVAHLTEALNRPEDRAEADQAIRVLIERIVLRPGAKRGQIDATLHGVGHNPELDCCA
ncbi:hypothetical protein [Bradyrhizobium sp. STM 3557]|uniref:hypothetical protein n=1 Tax=Bradyrhizobium sp. STM 3557 TaxID=578920 RepID=UPI00388E3467